MNNSQKLYVHFTSNYLKVVCGVLLGCVFIPASAQSIFGPDPDEAPKKREEVAVVIPPFPKEENLIAFDVSPTQTQAFSIDSTSLTRAGDEVRYTLVSVSPSGARNISYEGILCSNYEVRFYAYGHPNGEWSLSRSDKWRPIQFYAPNRPQAALAEDFFCDQKITTGTPAQMLERIRYKRSLLKRKYTSG